VGTEQFGDGVDHVDRAEHAQLHGGDGGVGQHGIGLGQDPLAVEHTEVGNVDGILHRQGSHGRCGVTALGEQGFYICLQAGAATWVVAGETEDNGAGAVGIHGRRAYHQTPLCGSSYKRVLLIDWSDFLACLR